LLLLLSVFPGFGGQAFIRAGADTLVAGLALFHGKLTENLRTLQNLAAEAVKSLSV
jgi:pentose-5-phosphate-3-epimerase